MCSSRNAADIAHAEYSAARARLLDAIADLASTQGWRGDGAGNLPSWLAARWQISLRTARELVREAEALNARPALNAALAGGEISTDQCKALMVLTREGTEDDEAWLEALPFWSFAELEREARKQVARDLERRDDGVYLRTRHTPDERYLRGEFQLHPEDGAALMAAVDALVPTETSLRDWDHASALALVELAKGSPSDRPTVVLSLNGAADVAALHSGGFVGAETARRLACDARLETTSKNSGRTSRTISPALRRAVEARDGGTCTFPGCGLDVFLECHHVIPFARSGPTVLSNLLLVCWKHHKLVHEGGWSLRGEAGPRITWIRPDGTPFEPRVRVVLDTC